MEWFINPVGKEEYELFYFSINKAVTLLPIEVSCQGLTPLVSLSIFSLYLKQIEKKKRVREDNNEGYAS